MNIVTAAERSAAVFVNLYYYTEDKQYYLASKQEDVFCNTSLNIVVRVNNSAYMGNNFQ